MWSLWEGSRARSACRNVAEKHASVQHSVMRSMTYLLPACQCMERRRWLLRPSDGRSLRREFGFDRSNASRYSLDPDGRLGRRRRDGPCGSARRASMAERTGRSACSLRLWSPRTRLSGTPHARNGERASTVLFRGARWFLAHGGALLIPSRSDEMRRSVLIVDQSQESREVLRTLLERRGMRIFEASGARQGLELVRRCHPEVVVLDLETDSDTEGEAEGAVREQYGAASAESEASLVLLSSAPRRLPAAEGQRIVSKPYHYAPLIRTIEELLEHSIAAERSK